MTQDEQISAYLDEHLSERERAEFAARLRTDDATRHKVEVTRLALQAAHQLPAVALPRNFTLPASMAQPEHSSVNWRLAFRIGSAFAAALVVVLIGLDLSLMLPRIPSLQPTPVIAPSPKEAPQPTLLTAQPVGELKTVVVPSASGPQLGVIETTQLTQLPQAPRAPHIANSSDAAVTAPQARATKSLNSLSKLTPTLIATAIPTAFKAVMALTPAPTLATAAPLGTSQSWATWPRLLAGLALAVGAVLAVLGWRK